MRVAGHSSVTVNHSNIGSNGGFGILVLDGSEAFVNGATISGNGTNTATSTNFKGGVSIANSTAQLNNANISNNLGRGVVVTGGGSLNAHNTAVTGSAVDGVVLYLGAIANIDGGTISGNGGNGLWVWVNSTAQTAGEANIQSNSGHGIQLNADSKLWVNGPTNVGANAGFGLNCLDAKSSAYNLSSVNYSPANGIGPTNCSGN